LKAASDVLYISRRGKLAGVLIDVDRYAEIVDRLEFLEDSLAALQARQQLEASVPWTLMRPQTSSADAAGV
jgi:PHD/YefM family antitoxin component YafN of YafNO toxin-antitoxin module